MKIQHLIEMVPSVYTPLMVNNQSYCIDNTHNKTKIPVYIGLQGTQSMQWA